MPISLIDRRRIEAETLWAFYNELARSKDEAYALDAIARTVSGIAYKAGQDFAAKAPASPSLEHFSSVVDLWNGTGNLEIVNVEKEADRLSFSVNRCKYVELYREMGVPQALLPILSCSRDAPFARGYSKSLKFIRQHTIGEGATSCDFLFQWEVA